MSEDQDTFDAYINIDKSSFQTPNTKSRNLGEKTRSQSVYTSGVLPNNTLKEIVKNKEKNMLGFNFTTPNKIRPTRKPSRSIHSSKKLGSSLLVLDTKPRESLMKLTTNIIPMKSRYSTSLGQLYKLSKKKLSRPKISINKKEKKKTNLRQKYKLIKLKVKFSICGFNFRFWILILQILDF